MEFSSSLSFSSSSAAEVPHYFLCPISLEVMRDPVTLATGITYDRASIERWLFTDGHATCPVTRRALAPAEMDATPNHTLRRLIQAWCAAHQVERFPTPRPPLDSSRVAALLEEGRRHGGATAALREIKAVVAESDRNRRCVEATPGAVQFLASLVTKHSSPATSAASTIKRTSSAQAAADDDFLLQVLDSPTSTTTSPAEDALAVLYSLKPSERNLAQIMERDGDFLDTTLTSVLRRSSYRSRTYGILLLKAMSAVMTPARLMTVSADLVQEVVRVVSDRVSSKAVKAALHVLCRLCPWGRNRVKAVEAGAVATLVELLLDEGGHRVTELAVVAIDHLCGCAEGRSELVAHPAGLAVVSKKAMRVSLVATESAVRALHSVARNSPTPAVLQEMLAVGVVAKLLLVLQVNAGERADLRAKEMLKAHARVWKDSPCLQTRLKAFYPC